MSGARHMEIGRLFFEGMVPQWLKTNLLQAHPLHRHIGQLLESSSQAGRQVKQISNHKAFNLAMCFFLHPTAPKREQPFQAPQEMEKRRLQSQIHKNPQGSRFWKPLSMYKPSFLLRVMVKALLGFVSLPSCGWLGRLMHA